MKLHIPNMYAVATLFNFGKWIDYGKSHPRVKFAPKGA